jgi:hypothetical protein
VLKAAQGLGDYNTEAFCLGELIYCSLELSDLFAQLSPFPKKPVLVATYLDEEPGKEIVARTKSMGLSASSGASKKTEANAKVGEIEIANLEERLLIIVDIRSGNVL